MRHPEPGAQKVRVEGKLFKRGLLLPALSVLLQVGLGLFLGHAYDMRIFMATGVLVGSGQNPYVPTDLGAFFHDSSFQGIPSFGYLPPWAQVLGLIYLVSYRLLPNFLLYNLALKLPIIAANICLAYLVAQILERFDVEEKVVRRAWIFMLFNPFFLLTTAAWGQFDSIVALLSLMSLVLLWEERLFHSAVLLALAIALKPTALPLLVVALVHLWGKSARGALRYLLTFSLSVILFGILPFILLKWDPSVIFQHWNFHFTVGGGLSFMTFLEFTRWTVQLPGGWWWLGWLWLPALAIAAPAARRIQRFDELLKISAAFCLVFLLSRAWLSETNLNLVLPLILILVSIRQLDRFSLAVFWILPLVFSFVNTSIAQLLFPSLPGQMQALLNWAVEHYQLRYFVRTILVAAWLVAGWRIALLCFRKTEATYSWS
jgi:hypothetical protein